MKLFSKKEMKLSSIIWAKPIPVRFMQLTVTTSLLRYRRKNITIKPSDVKKIY